MSISAMTRGATIEQLMWCEKRIAELEQLLANKANQLDKAEVQIEELQQQLSEDLIAIQQEQARILKLEQKLIGWPDLFDENMLLQVRVQELEQRLEVRFTENKELYGQWQNALDQNAKLVEVLKSTQANTGCMITQRIVTAALKEMEVKGENTSTSS